jgi:hypothetical protein
MTSKRVEMTGKKLKRKGYAKKDETSCPSVHLKWKQCKENKKR